MSLFLCDVVSCLSLIDIIIVKIKSGSVVIVQWNIRQKRGFHRKPLFCWDTRTRTRKNRTRICCVTITPYPNNYFSNLKQAPLVLKCDAKVRTFFVMTKDSVFFIKNDA